MSSEDLKSRIEEALGVARIYGQEGGEHHKMWVIDQMVRALTGEDYEQWVKSGSQHYEEWETGIIP